MNLNTNIVLVGNEGSTQPYVVQLIPTTGQVGRFSFSKDGNMSYLFSRSYTSFLYRNGNDWYEGGASGTTYEQMSQSTVRLYFPQYSVDTFNVGAKYILNLSTHINGIDVELGSFLFRRKDALACAPIRFDGMEEYYEYIDFIIADPFTLHYGDGSAALIRAALGEPTGLNNTSALLQTALFVVDEQEDSYIKRDGWTGGQNSIPISDPEDLTLHLKYIPETRKIDLKLTFNRAYAANIAEYFDETYNCDPVAAVIQYVVLDNNDMYYEQSKLIQTVSTDEFTFDVDTNEGSIIEGVVEDPSYNHSYSSSYDNETHVIPYYSGDNFFSSWDNFKEGLALRAAIMFFDPTYGLASYDEPFIVVFSNRVPLTKELFSMMVKSGGYDSFPTKLDLSTINMNDINLKAINRIEQNVTVVTPTDSTKNHLVQPIFYQTKELNNMILHPAVTENVSINLDAYKSQVDRFKLQVEGVVFNEIGRTKKGVVFKVVGNMLPKEENEGSMFILNQDGDLVTTGKYTYLF